jgi:DNA transformation protein and related proteins
LAGQFNDLLEELFAPVGGVGLRRMFGGIGVFKEGIMFGLVANDVLYMKADETTSPGYAAEDCGPFIYDGMKGKSVAMPYWRLPDRLLDEPDEFRDWADAAFAVAVRTAKPKKKKAPKRRVRS